MEDPMTLSTSTARRTLFSALTALALTAALPQAGLAATTSDDGIWRVDAAKSNFSAGSATLSIARAASVNPAAGSFIVISKGSVYRVTSAAASDGKGVQQVDYARMTKEGTAVLIGTNARSADLCGFRCQGGLPEPRMTVTFKAVNGAGQQINDMLAEQKQ
jgi:hypothetical protein